MQIFENPEFITIQHSPNITVLRPVLTDEERARRMERIKAAMLEIAKAMLDARREGEKNDVV